MDCIQNEPDILLPQKLATGIIHFTKFCGFPMGLKKAESNGFEDEAGTKPDSKLRIPDT